MAKLRLNGDTSGYIDIQPPAVADNSTLDLSEVITTSNATSKDIITTSNATSKNIITTSSLASYLVPTTGEVIQSKSSTTGFALTTQSINSTTKQAVNGMSVTITPKYNNSKMLIFGYIVSNAPWVMGVGIYKNGSSLITNNNQTLQTGGSTALWTTYRGTDVADQNWVFPFMYEDTVTNTNSTIYALYANAGWNGATRVLIINDRSADDMRSQSWITVQEIKV